MKRQIATLALAAYCGLAFSQTTWKAPEVYKPAQKNMYHKGWIDFNKNGVKDVYEDPNAPIDARIEDLLGQMTLEEKTCQMVTLYGYKRVLKDDLPTPEWKNELWKDGIGAIDEHLNGFQQWGLPPSDNENVWPASRHAWALNEVQRFFVEDTRLGIPTDFTNEGIRGVESYKATNFPTQLGLGHTWNRDLIYKVGLITGHEARMLGYTNVYAPILDVGRDQRWGRYEEVYGESPFLVAELGIEMVKGLQHNHQVAATGKHFVAYSNNKGAREGMARVDPQMSPREVEMIHVYPFRRVIKEAGMLGVMSSYNDYDGIPIQGSFYWLTTRLRGEMGFKGYVVSDSDAVEYLYTKHGTAKDMKEAVRQSVEAGLNVRCTFRSPESFVEPLRELVKEGGISMETIDNRVRDILRVKFMVGLFDTPYQMNPAKADEEVEKEKSEAVALQASRECLVLLKNENNALPLNPDAIKTIAVCGPNANEESYALGHYGPLAVEVTTVLKGIQSRMAGKADVLYTKGCELVDEHWPESELIDYPLTQEEQAEIDRAVENARKADVAIVVLGGGQRTCGENKSRSSLDLPGRQLKLLQAVQATGKPTILVLINGRPLSINWADKFVPAIIEAWYPGSKGGQAIAEALFGDYNPGGKLTVTFPKSVGQIPFNFPTKPSAQIDGGKNPGLTGNMSRVNGPLYSFGHGLSYTTFEYTDMKIEPQTITPQQRATVSLTVTNTGQREGDEVVQLYLRDVLSSVTTYEKNLAGFERIHLKPGESCQVSFQIDRKHLELLDADMKWVVEPGDFAVMAGASSEDIRLNGLLTVENYNAAKYEKADKSPVSASTNQDMTMNVLDGDLKTAWQGNKGDYITFALPSGSKMNSVAIAFARENKLPTDFEIQLSGGGGQFLTVYKGTVTEYDKLHTYTFKGTTASDLRIVLNDDRVGITEVKLENDGKATTTSGKDQLSMIVGTYTNGTSKGIYTLNFDLNSGKAVMLDSFQLANPSFLTPSADGKRIYAVSEMNDKTAALSALSFDRTTGKLQMLNQALTHGEDPCYIATNGQIALTANYSGGSMSVFRIGENGQLQGEASLFKGNIGGPDPLRQNAPHIHCAYFTPDGHYIRATDFSADRILRFELKEDGSVVPLKEAVKIAADSGPRHLTFSPNGKYVYLISELSGHVTAFSYNNGSLKQIQSIDADAADARGSADIHISPDGRFLYASNRLKQDGICIFAIDPAKGTLTQTGYQLTGIHPRNFNITPNGKYLLVACRDSNVIQVFERNAETGQLTDTRQNIVIDKPVCIQFID